MTTINSPLPAVVPVRVIDAGWRSDGRAIKVVLQRELIRFGQDRTRLVAALVQPVLFLFVLGTGLGSLTRSSTGGINLRTFLFPGVLATSTLFTAMFSAMSIVWDREFGFLREMLVAPVRRGSIVIGKALGGATVATLQGLLVVALGPLVHVPSYRPALLAVILVELFLLSFTLTAFGLVIAARIQQMQAMMGIMQVVLLPLSFLSGALYPTRGLPAWMSAIVHANPLTYAVHSVRASVFAQLHMDDATRQALNPDLRWFGWTVPMWAALALVAAVGAALLSVAIWEFGKAE